jgi:hypothetical protein
VRRMEAVASSIPVPGSDDTVHGVSRGVSRGVAGEEVDNDLDEGGVYDEGLSDGQSAWDVEMPDHISLVSDEDGGFCAEFRYHPMTTRAEDGNTAADIVSGEIGDEAKEEEEKRFRLLMERYFDDEESSAPQAATAAGEKDSSDDDDDDDVDMSDIVAMALSDFMEQQEKQHNRQEEEEEEEVHKAVMIYFGIPEI